jgi:transposase
VVLRSVSRVDRRLKPTLRQVHIAGERLFVDFAGHTMEVIDAATGEIQRAEIFVAVLGASSFIYAEATASQALADWICAHVNALSAIGGVPRRGAAGTPDEKPGAHPPAHHRRLGT